MNSSDTKATVHREGALVSQTLKPVELPVEVEMGCILFTCLSYRWTTESWLCSATNQQKVTSLTFEEYKHCFVCV